MKNRVLIVFVLLICISAYSQQPWIGLGSFSKSSVPGFENNPSGAFSDYGTKVHRLVLNWKEYGTAPGVYNWTDLDNTIAKFAATGKYLQLQFLSGDLCPDWVYTKYGSFNTSGGNRNGPWPDYRNESFREAWFAWNRDVQEHIMSLPQKLKSKIVCLVMSFGSTGDNQPYKGKPVGYKPININLWTNESKRYWDSIVAVAVRLNADTVYALGFNPASEYLYFDYFYKTYNYLRKIPWFKLGDASHFYAFDGCGIQIGGGDTVAYGETQFPIPGNLVHPRKEGRALIWQALHKNIQSLQIAPNWWKAMKDNGESVTDRRITDPLNLYMNTQSRGFSIPTGQVMYDDTRHYPESTYGSLIDPAFQSQYNSELSQINDVELLGWRAKKMISYNKMRRYINQTRVNNLLAANPDALYQKLSFATDPNYKQWNNDIFIDGILNLEKNVTMLAPFETTVQRRRVGPDSSMWGRGAFQFKIENAAAEVDYNISDNISVPANNKMQLTVHYLDSGNGSWSINCMSAENNFKKSIKNTNSGLVKDMVILVDGFKFNKGISKDFSLKYEGGDNTVFCGIEVWNTSKSE